MKVKSDWDDDTIQFAGFGSACTLTEYAKPRKPKRRKFKVGFAIPKKAKTSIGSSQEPAPKTRGVS